MATTNGLPETPGTPLTHSLSSLLTHKGAVQEEDVLQIADYRFRSFWDTDQVGKLLLGQGMLFKSHLSDPTGHFPSIDTGQSGEWNFTMTTNTWS